MNQKALIIVVIILVVVFVCGVGVGTFGQCNPDDPGCKFDTSPPSWLSSLGGVFGGLQSLSDQDIQNPGCFVSTPTQRLVTLNQFTSCTLGIVASSSPVRSASLTLIQGLQAGITLNPLGESSLPVDTTLEPSDGNSNNGNEANVSLTIQKEGATLTLTCAAGTGSPSQCRIQFD